MTRGGVSHMPVSFETVENGVKVASRANCLWSKCMNNIRALLTVLKENPELTEESTGQADTNQIQPTNAIQPSDFDDDDEMPIQVSSNLVSFVERLDDELFLSLRLEDHHSASFPKRLLDIDLLLELALDVQNYYQGLNNTSVVGRLSMRRLEHLYYKPDALVAAAAKVNPQKGDRAEKRHELIAELALNVYKYGDDSIKMRAMLCHIYYHALHGRFMQARDMLLMSHLQDSVHQANNVSIQILFNRVMAQLGLSAFRTGMILEAHQCFDELCQGNRLKELLAQGISMNRYNNERSPEQEKAEKRRQTPYHMHMNIDLIESCHLVGAILIEIPKMVANQFDTKRKVTSKALKRVFEASDRNPLAGPPENTPREIIFAGAKALERGNWRECEGYILGLPVWQHLGSEEVVAKVKAMLRTRIQEEALRTYLFAYSAYYDALSCDQLCEMFELSKPAVSTLISKMILSDDRDVAPLSASWDQPTGSLVMHKKERSRLHHLSLQLSDTLGKLVETNEKGWDAKYGGYDFFKGQNKQGWQGRGGPQGAGRGGNRDGNKDGNREDRRDGGGRGGGGWGKK
jgi:translation initiation factor 3 subunit C